MASIAVVKEFGYPNTQLPLEAGKFYTSSSPDTFLGDSPDPENPNVAALCCPACEMIGAVITLRQLGGLDPIECKTRNCGSVYYYRGGKLELRRPH